MDGLMTDTRTSRRRGLGFIRAAALALAVAVVTGVGVWAWTQRDGDEVRTVSIVNDDAGVDGTKVGDQVADLLRQSGEFRWEVVDAADARDHFATVTIPADFTAAIQSLTTPDPRQAVLTVRYNGGSPGDQARKIMGASRAITAGRHSRRPCSSSARPSGSGSSSDPTAR